MEGKGFPTSSDIYLELEGKKVAVVQGYTADGITLATATVVVYSNSGAAIKPFTKVRIAFIQLGVNYLDFCVAADIIFAGQPVGTQISESATCQLVGSRFGHRTNSTSSGTTVSHIIFIRHDFELTDSLHRNGVWHTVATGCTTSRSRALGTHAINGIIKIGRASCRERV